MSLRMSFIVLCAVLTAAPVAAQEPDQEGQAWKETSTTIELRFPLLSRTVHPDRYDTIYLGCAFHPCTEQATPAFPSFTLALEREEQLFRVRTEVGLQGFSLKHGERRTLKSADLRVEATPGWRRFALLAGAHVAYQRDEIPAVLPNRSFTLDVLARWRYARFWTGARFGDRTETSAAFRIGTMIVDAQWAERIQESISKDSTSRSAVVLDDAMRGIWLSGTVELFEDRMLSPGFSLHGRSVTRDAWLVQEKTGRPAFQDARLRAWLRANLAVLPVEVFVQGAYLYASRKRTDAALVIKPEPLVEIGLRYHF